MDEMHPSLMAFQLYIETRLELHYQIKHVINIFIIRNGCFWSNNLLCESIELHRCSSYLCFSILLKADANRKLILKLNAQICITNL
jgi:hypothetical protein